ncbi:MAG TPA: signal recognition particle-docking protein FtsY, partial [Erwinia persicina]|nr:signal recognition particle-docking protein FtsY [Erwinia persicina]HBT28578.1 signal recognition particle-docking protein FtsY [Erwinia persicina]
MAKNKKRGFFSWLGLGREEQTPQEEVKETLPPQPAADSPAEAPPAAPAEADA